MIGGLDEKELPNTLTVGELNGISIMLFNVEPGKKCKESAQIGKLHYSFGTNTFIKYIADAIKNKRLRSLRAFMDNYKYSELMQVIGTDKSLRRY